MRVRLQIGHVPRPCAGSLMIPLPRWDFPIDVSSYKQPERYSILPDREGGSSAGIFRAQVVGKEPHRRVRPPDRLARAE